MERTVFWQGAVASVAAAFIVLAGTPSEVGAANTDPTVYEAHDYGPNHMSQASNPAAYLTLKVPAGRWVAWARLQTYSTQIRRHIKCTLTATNGALGRPSPAAGQSAQVTTLAQDEFDTIALTASIKSLRSQVTFALRCRDESSTQQRGNVDALQSRIVAMRLSSLTQTQLQNAGSSSSAPSPQGRSTSPAELTVGYRTSDLSIPKSGSPQTLATLALAAGLWSIRTSFSIVALSGNETGDPINRGNCRLVLATNTSPVSTTADAVFVNIGDPGHDEDREAYYLDTSGALGTPGVVKLQCWQTVGQGELVVRNLRIAALKDASLKIGNASTGSVSSSYGRGIPAVRYTRTQAAFQIPDSPETIVGWIKLPAGTWYVYAKLDFDSTSIVCHLGVPELGEDQMDMVGHELVLGRVTELESFSTLGVSCERIQGSGPPIEISYVHLTAIRVKLP